MLLEIVGRTFYLFHGKSCFIQLRQQLYNIVAPIPKILFNRNKAWFTLVK